MEIDAAEGGAFAGYLLPRNSLLNDSNLASVNRVVAGLMR
jgi:hypothetical protein